jgi:cytidylate kinase
VEAKKSEPVKETAQQLDSPPVGGLFPGDAPQAQSTPVTAVSPLQSRLPSGGFAEAFAKVGGANAVQDLVANFTSEPVVLIAGDQLTGKSTAARAVASELGGEASGTGKVVRKLAEERGISIEEMSKDLKDEPELDAQIDLRAANMIGQGDASAFESRLAGHLGEFLKGLGRENIMSVYLACGPKERALRYINREQGEDARARIEPQLNVPADASLRDCLIALGDIDDPAAQAVAKKFDGIASRDANDKSRLMALYGVDYQDRSAFDVVIDTTGKTPDQVQQAIVEAVQKHLPNAQG